MLHFNPVARIMSARCMRVLAAVPVVAAGGTSGGAPGTTMGVGDDAAVIIEAEFSGPPLAAGDSTKR